MRFREWVESQPRGVLKRIERETGIGYTTLHRIRSGKPLSRFDVAKKVSEATGGEVTVEDLCEVNADEVAAAAEAP